MRAFRIADRRFPIFDGTGARLLGGRWNSPGRPVIYATETYAGALLEVLVHANLGRVPKTHSGIVVEIPEFVRIEVLRASDCPRWDAADQFASRAWGDQWLTENRSAVLLVPSLVTGGREQNAIINPLHAEFKRISATEPEPVRWDGRLFGLC